MTHPPTTRTTAYTMPPALIALALTILALIPRVVATGTFVTPDEGDDWFVWSGQFLEALGRGDFAHTVFVGHPGVTTLWLGALGHLLAQGCTQIGWLDPGDYIGKMHLLRLPLGVVTAACVGLAYPLLRALFGGPTALIAGLLWASSPFLVGLSQVLHVDALQTSFMTLALLSALLAFGIDGPGARPADLAGLPRLGMLLASALCGGLALLTKSPSITLLPMVGLIAVTAAWRRQPHRPLPGRLARAVGGAALHVLAWAALVALTWVALWPLAWVDVGQAVGHVVSEVVNNGAQPHEAGNYFFGQVVADPGPLFYPLALAFRLTPWTLLGAALGLFALARGPLAPPRRVALALLLLCGLLYILALTVMAKKLDRYILPTIPTIELLAAVGYVWAASWIAGRLGRRLERVSATIAAALLALSAATLAWYHPYELSYYNPLLGGGRVAEDIFAVGWGEGYDQAVAFIASQPDACQRPISLWMPSMIEGYRPRCWKLLTLRALRNPERDIGYVILYRDAIQRGLYADVVDKLYGKALPVHVVRIHGIEIAYIYHIPHPIANPVDARFGSAIRLQGYAVQAEALRQTGTISLQLQWQALAPLTEGVTLFVHLLNQDGERITQIDVPPGGPEAPISGWKQNFYVYRNQPIPVPATLPAGTYWLAIGLYDSATFARLPVGNPPQVVGAPAYDPDALLLGPISIP